MSSIAIITARGGSKRIPKKNIRDFCGKPIIAYSIEAAINSGVFSEVMVSTDSEEIAEIAKKYGANVPFFRSEKTSTDYATTRDVLLEVLSDYEKMGKKYDEMVCIYPTAPFVTSEKLKSALNLLTSNHGSLVIPVVRFSYPPQRAYVVKNDKLEFKWEEYRNSRSQDLEAFYHDAGQFYCYHISDYLDKNGVITENILPLELSELEVQDIDNEEDWCIAEMKYNLIGGRQ
jgi:N-acylneuraminate cytidylyltransferase